MPSKFTGLAESDFRDTVDGTTWRGTLGPILARELSQAVQRPLAHTPIYKRPQIFLAPRDRGRPGLAQAKLVVEARGVGLHFGFYVERGYPPGTPDKNPGEIMGAGWHWHGLVRLLQDPVGNGRLRRLVFERGFAIGDPNRPFGVFGAQGERLVPLGGSEAAQRDAPADWVELCQRILAAPPDQWLDLFVCRTLSPADSVARGAAIVTDILDGLQEVLPIMDAVSSTSPPCPHLAGRDPLRAPPGSSGPRLQPDAARDVPHRAPNQGLRDPERDFRHRENATGAGLRGPHWGRGGEQLPFRVGPA